MEQLQSPSKFMCIAIATIDDIFPCNCNLTRSRVVLELRPPTAGVGHMCSCFYLCTQREIGSRIGIRIDILLWSLWVGRSVITSCRQYRNIFRTKRRQILKCLNVLCGPQVWGIPTGKDSVCSVGGYWSRIWTQICVTTTTKSKVTRCAENTCSYRNETTHGDYCLLNGANI